MYKWVRLKKNSKINCWIYLRTIAKLHPFPLLQSKLYWTKWFPFFHTRTRTGMLYVNQSMTSKSWIEQYIYFILVLAKNLRLRVASRQVLAETLFKLQFMAFHLFILSMSVLFLALLHWISLVPKALCNYWIIWKCCCYSFKFKVIWFWFN